MNKISIRYKLKVLRFNKLRIIIKDNSVNNYVENGYIDNYFE